MGTAVSAHGIVGFDDGRSSRRRVSFKCTQQILFRRIHSSFPFPELASSARCRVRRSLVPHQCRPLRRLAWLYRDDTVTDRQDKAEEEMERACRYLRCTEMAWIGTAASRELYKDHRNSCGCATSAGSRRIRTVTCDLASSVFPTSRLTRAGSGKCDLTSRDSRHTHRCRPFVLNSVPDSVQQLAARPLLKSECAGLAAHPVTYRGQRENHRLHGVDTSGNHLNFPAVETVYRPPDEPVLPVTVRGPHTDPHRSAVFALESTGHHRHLRRGHLTVRQSAGQVARSAATAPGDTTIFPARDAAIPLSASHTVGLAANIPHRNWTGRTADRRDA